MPPGRIPMDRLKQFIQETRSALDADWDMVLIIDGHEGTGKSTLGILMKAIYEGGFSLDNIIFDGEQLISAMERAPNKSCIILDESILSLYKRESLVQLNRDLAKAFSIIRAKNFFFILVLPNYYDLDGHLRFRANWRFNCWTVKRHRGWATAYLSVRNVWTRNEPWLLAKWVYKFSMVNPDFFVKYNELKMVNINKKLKEFQEEYGERQKRGPKPKGETKKDKIIQYQKENPNASAMQISKALGVNLSHVYKYYNSSPSPNDK